MATKRMIIDTRAYELAHGHIPRGRGGWLFYFDESNDAPAEHAWCPGGDLTYAEAKKLATQRASEIGAFFITVAS
jgi:hypothetical protein